MATSKDERLEAELELLEAMYPDQITYGSKTRELKYTSSEGTFTVRVPSGYLSSELPEVLSASIGRDDARQEVKRLTQSLSAGEEVLDSLIAAFTELAEARTREVENEGQSASEGLSSSEGNAASATVIIWLHHLLNTNKRKLALSPPDGVSGITKPGYPGVLIYSGHAKSVQEHVAELKQQNWQAFQVRLESEDEWVFAHGRGVREVEGMRDVVGALGEARKEAFMEAMRMK